MSGGFDAIDLGSFDVGSLTSFASDVGSAVTDFGTEFMTSVGGLDFQIPNFDIPDLGGFGQVGSLAGNTSWFDTFNPGSILDSIPSVSDFNISSLTSSLPSLSSIQKAAGAIGLPTTAEGLASSVTKLASNPTALAVASQVTGVPPNLLSSAAGVASGSLTSGSLPSLASIASNPTAIAAAAGATGIPTGLLKTAAGFADGPSSGFSLPSLASIASNPTAIAAAAGATGVPTGLLKTAAGFADGPSSGFSLPSLSSLTSNPSIVSSGAAALGINPGLAQSLTAKATNLFASDPNAANARDVATSLPVSNTGTVDAYGLNILSAAETAEVTKGISPAFLNSLVDPGTPTVSNYDQAVASRNDLLANRSEIISAITANEKVIRDSKMNIEEMQQNLADPNLSDAQRERLRLQIAANEASLAEANDALFENQSNLQDLSEQLDRDQQIITQTDATSTRAPAAAPSPTTPTGQTEQANRYISTYDPETGTWSVWDNQTSTTVSTNLTEQEATLAEQDLNISTGITLASQPNNIDIGGAAAAAIPRLSTANTGVEQGTNVANLVAQARNQQALRNLRQDKAQSSDWRVRLKLAPNATYLYNDPNGAGILEPLSSKTGSDGVIFPYTPAIETAYKANYETYDLTHSNYRGYFYKNSHVDVINIRATFTAQDTTEANYLLAVIHFFRSVTKMFYGQDPQKGSPPPLVYLNGLGDFQFNEHPCVVSQFNYTLPADVDYIRAYSTLDMSTNLLGNRTRTSIPGNPLSYGINRLLNSGLFTGATPSTLPGSNLPIKNPTYVPTKMEISIALLPMQSRQQVSTQFSLKGFANGNLLRGGFW